LAKLDSKSLSKIKIDDEDNQSIGTRDTFQSWASNWSDCTNATFNRVHKYWKSNSALHKEVGNSSFKRKE
jgi:2-polyprenyl-3-methyl-5-hydroxy-6-metoxy-1,4-benzoquinol methylase